jgi:hypothetical protein
MKLQYLGDYRDAFKWDLLHWVCSNATPPFGRLVFVPLLTPDDPTPSDGQIPHHRFVARPFIHAFTESLRDSPRSLGGIARLGRQPGEYTFEVHVHEPDLHIARNAARAEYWSNLPTTTFAQSIVFLDPDNGFESKTRHGHKWVRHAEVEWLLQTLPSTSAVIVYQHRPRYQPWERVLADVAAATSYAPFACAAHDATLAFIALAGARDTFNRLHGALSTYAAQHARVEYAKIRCVGA